MGTSVQRFDRKIQRGRGKAANKLGQTYDVRRLNASTNVSVTSNRPVLYGLAARIEKTTSKVKIENSTFDLQVYKATTDNRQLHVGDVLTETGFEAQPVSYIFAQRRPTRETLWVRTEFAVSITRPRSDAGRVDQMPAQGGATLDAWSGGYKANEQILTLTSGLYSFQQSGTAAVVLVGMQPLNRLSDASVKGVPTAFYRERFVCYVPELPGDQLMEEDVINVGLSDRYEVALVYSSDQVGFTGYICIVEKLGV